MNVADLTAVHIVLILRIVIRNEIANGKKERADRRGLLSKEPRNDDEDGLGRLREFLRLFHDKNHYSIDTSKGNARFRRRIPFVLRRVLFGVTRPRTDDAGALDARGETSFREYRQRGQPVGREHSGRKAI